MGHLGFLSLNRLHITYMVLSTPPEQRQSPIVYMDRSFLAISHIFFPHLFFIENTEVSVNQLGAGYP